LNLLKITLIIVFMRIKTSIRKIIIHIKYFQSYIYVDE
jgi:hypothetical protein